MAARTVLSDTQTTITTYSSGALTVGDLHEMTVDIDVTVASGGTPTATYAGRGTVGEDPTPVDFYLYTFTYDFVISRLTAFDELIPIVGPVVGTLGITLSQATADPPDPPSRASEAVAFTGMTTLIVPAGLPFGDRIQVDLNNPQGIEMTFTLSIIGK
jgi:hypothetical protein